MSIRVTREQYNRTLDFLLKEKAIYFDPRKADCYKCPFRCKLPGDTHIECIPKNDKKL